MNTRAFTGILFLASFLFVYMPAGNSNELSGEEFLLMDKVTFRVDMRNETVAATGVFIAADFLFTIGYTNWTFLPMCDLGGGIWEVSFVDIPPGTYQYKFVNGNAPPMWEFDGFGGPCTNPLDNNNRWVTVTGGVQEEGPYCFDMCDVYCPGYSNPGVSDTTPPTIDEPAPSNTSIECGNPLPVGVELAASDACDVNATTSTGLPTDDNSGLGPCGTGDIIRTWEVMDCAGNTTSVTQVIMIEDTNLPTIDNPIPADVTVECGNEPSPVSLSASDDCDAGITETGPPTDDNSGLNACGIGVVVRTWEVTDCSGNTFSASQNITLTDNTGPTIDVPIPADVTIECGNVPAPVSLFASDNCDSNVSETGMPSDDNSGINSCGTGEVIRTWTVPDCSGNETTASQTITVEDNTAPNITAPVPANVTVSCGNIPAAAALTASDDCYPGVTTTGLPTDDNSGLNACGVGEVIRTWEVTDCSGNTTTVSQTITVEDITAPTIDEPVPVNIMVNCADPLPTGQALNASDNCDAGIASTGLPVDDNSGVGPCGVGEIVRTWSVTDCSGNETTVSQTITITDDTEPVITEPVPPNVTVDCQNIPPPAPLAALDDCDVTVVTTGFPHDDFSGIGSCGTGELVRTWTVTDCSGNETIASQIITISDLNGPVIDDPIPFNTTVECGNVPPAFPLAASDDCDNTVTTTGLPVDDASGLSSCGAGQLLRTWSVSDCSGNVTTEVQVINVEDNSPPNLTIPADTTYQCGNVPPATAADATASDNCSTPAISYDGEVMAGSGCPHELHRTWTATDECGNSISLIQVITVTDTIAPAFINSPADVTVCTGDEPPMVDLEWTDNCDGSGMVAGVDMSDGMSNPETISRTWTFTDACGNTGSYTQTITVQEAGAANAGGDLTICAGSTVEISADVSGGFDSALWTTSGDGVFDDETADSTFYVPGTIDIDSGSVILIFTATTSSGNCTQAIDSIIITIDSLPMAEAGGGPTITCDIPEVILDGSGSSSGSDILFEWSGPGINTGNSNLQNPQVSLPGTYLLTVTDTGSSAACSAIDSVIVLENTLAPTADAGPDQTLTCMQTVITLSGSGNAGPAAILFTWTGPGITAASQNLPNPSVSEPGLYILTITNTENGCTATDQTEIFLDGELPNADAGPDQTINCLNTSAVLDASNSTSGPGIIYQWVDPNGNSLGSDPVQTVSTGGIYSFTVNDTNNGCSITATVEVLVDDASPVVDAGADMTISCDAPAVVLGGSSSQGPEFDYEWLLGGIVQGTNTNLTTSIPGNYTLIVTDTGNGCTASDDVEVLQDANVPIASAGPDQLIDCNNPVVILDGSGSSSGPEFIYDWSGPGFSSADINPEVSTAGVYILVVTNTLNSCTATDSVWVDMDAGLPVANAGSDTLLTCFTTDILLDGSNSTQGNDITYEWTNDAGATLGNDQTVLISESGTYTLEIFNSLNGCIAVDEVVVGIDTLSPVADAGPDAVLTCVQSTVVLEGAGSSTGNDFAYLWSGSGIVGDSTAQSITVVETGTYILIVTNLENGCTASDEVTVLQDADVPTADAGPDQEITCLVSAVSLQGSASVSGATYQWEGPGINASNELLPDPAVSEPGTYSLVVTDLQTGCSSPPSLVTVNDNRTPPVIAFNQLFELGCFDPQVTLEAEVSPASGSFGYVWTGPGFSSNDSMPVVTQAGDYELTVTQMENGCTASQIVNVMQLQGIESVEFSTFAPACSGGGVLQIDTVIAGSPPFLYSLDGINFSPTVQFTELLPGVYTLTVKDDEGCLYEADFAISEGQGVEVDLGDDLTIGLGDSIILSPLVIGAVSQYQWTPSAYLSCSDCPEPSAAPFETTSFMLTVSTVDGCQASDGVTIFVDPRINVYVPNAFSPNGDGINDRFILFGGSRIVSIRSFMIFDRWGAVMFEGKNLPPGDVSAGWDGTHKGREMDTGVYVYFAEILLADGRVEILEGEIVLIR